MVRPSRKNRSVKSNINRVKRNARNISSKMAEVASKAQAGSPTTVCEGGTYYTGDHVTSTDEAGVKSVRVRMGGINEHRLDRGSVRGRVRGKKTIVTRNPKRGFQIAGRTKVDHKDTRFYRNKKGQVVEKRKSGRTSEKDPVIKMLNDLRKNGVEYDITRVYSAGSRKLKGTQSMMALEISKPNYAGKVKRYQAWAYYDAEGKAKIMFESGGNSLLGALKGLDEAMGMRPGEVPLKQYYEEMTLDAQARVAEALRDVDWDEVFDDIVYLSDPDAGADQMGTWEARDMIRSIMDEYVTAI